MKYLTPPAPLLPIAACLMAGIAIGQVVAVGTFLFPLAVVLTLLTWRWPTLQSWMIMGCCLLLGMLVGLWGRPKSVSLPDERVKVSLVVTSEPKQTQRSVAFDALSMPDKTKLKCWIEKDSFSCMLKVGDGLTMETRLRPFAADLPESYQRYLKTHGYQGQCYAASDRWQPSVVDISSLSRLQRSRLYFLRLRHRLTQRLGILGEEGDGYAVITAMVLGNRNALTPQLKETYSLSGTSHILALSGLHMGIIYALITMLFRGGRRKVVAQVASIAGVWAFAFMVGLPTSVVRAATMLTMFAVMSVGQRKNASANVLMFTAILMLLFNPMTLFDVGFQLSFASVLAILYWMPLVKTYFSNKWIATHKALWWIVTTVAVSVAAQIGTAPLVAYYFGRLPVWFVVANIFVIPLATTIIYATIALLLLPIPTIAWLLNALVSLMNTFLSWLASWPLASIEGLHPNLLQVCLCYVVSTALFLAILKYKDLKVAPM